MKKLAFFLVLLTLGCAKKDSDELPKWVNNPSAWDTETVKAFVGHAEGVDDPFLAIILAANASINNAKNACDEVDCEGFSARSEDQFVISTIHHNECNEEVELFEAYILLLVPRKFLKNQVGEPPTRGVKT